MLTSSREENNNLWESSCCICVFLAVLGSLLCKSCTRGVASCCLNIPGRLKLGLGRVLTKGHEREERCPPAQPQRARCLQLVPGCGESTPRPRAVLLSGWVARRDGPAAGALARARCLGKATVAVGAGREDATASRPKMPERGKRWDGMGWDGMPLCHLELLFCRLLYTQGTAQRLLPDGKGEEVESHGIIFRD